jgi:hypothetical protein
MERCCAERPEQSQGSRFVAGDSFTLDGGKGRLCYGFLRGNEGFKTRNKEPNEEPNKEDDGIPESRGAGGQRYDRDKLLSLVHEVTTHFRMPNGFERSKMRAVCRYWADALDRCSGSTLQQRWNDFEKRFWPKWKASINRPGGTYWTWGARVLISARMIVPSLDI